MTLESNRDVSEKTGAEIMALNAFCNALKTLEEIDAKR
jgi:hypothetical protein